LNDRDASASKILLLGQVGMFTIAGWLLRLLGPSRLAAAAIRRRIQFRKESS
jgi:hypothetical protein